ncbi:MAG: sugar phosphate isomerase/epimerase family protein [Lactovum sp.]
MLIRGHDLQKHTVEQVLDLKKEYGISGYQLALKKSFPILSEELSFKDIELISPLVFENTAILGAYFNPVDPNKDKISIGIKNFIFNMKLAEKNKIKYVASETGSKMGTPWDYHPDNHKKETVAESIAAFQEISRLTQGIEVKIAIEPAYHHVIKDIESLEYLYQEINDERIVYILDIFNLLNSRPYEDYLSVIEHFLQNSKDRLAIVHLKDFIIEDNQVKQVAIGKGIVDFKQVIQILKDYKKDLLFVLEGTLEENLKVAMETVNK